MFSFLTDIIKDPWFGFALAILSIIAGIITSQYYYKKGIRDGEATAKEYKEQLTKANSKIAQQSEKLDKANETINDLYKIAHLHDVDTADIKQILIAERSNPANDEQIFAEFENLLKNNKVQEAKNYFIGIKSKVLAIGVKAYMEGMVNFNDENYTGALIRFEEAIDLNPDANSKAFLHRLRADIYFSKLNKQVLAIEELTKIIDLFPSDVETHCNIAKCYIHIQEYQLAEQWVNKAMQINDQYKHAHIISAVVKLKLGRLDDAIAQAVIALTLGGDPAYLLGIKAEAFRYKGDYTTAEELYTKSLQLDPNSQEVIEGLIASYIEMKDYYAAERVGVTNNKKFPANKNILGLYLTALNYLGKHKQAIELAEKVPDLEVSYNSYFLQINLAKAYLYDQQYEKAKELIDKLLTVFPNDSSSLHLLLCYSKDKPQKDYNTAIYCCEKIIELGEGSADMINLLGLFYHKIGNYEQAVEYYNKALSIDPTHAAALHNRSLVYSTNTSGFY